MRPEFCDFNSGSSRVRLWSASFQNDSRTWMVSTVVFRPKILDVPVASARFPKCAWPAQSLPEPDGFAGGLHQHQSVITHIGNGVSALNSIWALATLLLFQSSSVALPAGGPRKETSIVQSGSDDELEPRSFPSMVSAAAGPDLRKHASTVTPPGSRSVNNFLVVHHVAGRRARRSDWHER